MLEDDIAWALPQMRAEAESRMVDHCTITKAGVGKGDWNESTMQYDSLARVIVYSGPCEVQRGGATAADSSAAGGNWSEQQVIVKLPISGSEDVARDHVVRFDTGVFDAALEGREVTVVALAHKTHATARRLGCTEGV